MPEHDDLLTRLAQGLVEGTETGVPLPTRMCRAACRILGCDGGAITLAYSRPERVTLCATDDTARAIEEVQDVIGQGPGPDAFASGAYARLELLPSDDGPDPRWPLLEGTALTDLAPVVVHALPIGEGDQVIGVLTVYGRAADHEIDLDSAVMISHVLAAGLLADGPVLHEADEGPWAERAEVHQATGMIVAQLGIPEKDALALVRAHAYSHDQSVSRTAHAVVSHELAFSASPEREIEST